MDALLGRSTQAGFAFKLMRRDPDLIRDILLFVEKKADDDNFFAVEIEGHDQRHVSYHVNLLLEQQYLRSRAKDRVIRCSTVDGLTWKGHDYLDAIRSNEVWSKVQQLSKPLGSVTLDVLKELALKVARGELGLG